MYPSIWEGMAINLSMYWGENPNLSIHPFCWGGNSNSSTLLKLVIQYPSSLEKVTLHVSTYIWEGMVFVEGMATHLQIYLGGNWNSSIYLYLERDGHPSTHFEEGDDQKSIYLFGREFKFIYPTCFLAGDGHSSTPIPICLAGGWHSIYLPTYRG